MNDVYAGKASDGLLASNLYGNGFPPGKFAHGLSRPNPATATVNEYGETVLWLTYVTCDRYSWAMPTPPRMAVRPSPVRSQAKPARGSQLLKWLFTPEVPEKPGSPGYAKPAGANGM